MIIRPIAWAVILVLSAQSFSAVAHTPDQYRQPTEMDFEYTPEEEHAAVFPPTRKIHSTALPPATQTSVSLGFIDQEPVSNDLSGNLKGQIRFAQSHTIYPHGNSARELPTLISDRSALLMFTPLDQTARSNIRVTAKIDGRELGTLDMAKPEAFPKSDQNNMDGRPRVQYSLRTWSVNLPWNWMKPSLSLHFSDSQQEGTLAAQQIEFTGSPEYVVQWIRVGMLTDYNTEPTYIEKNPAKAAIEYFQKTQLGKLTFGYYLPVKFDKVVLPNGTVYTEHSEDEGKIHFGDMREHIGKALVSKGINWANIGHATTWAAGNQEPLRPYRQITAHNSWGHYANGVVKHGLSGGGSFATLTSTNGNEFSHELGHDHGMGHYPGGGKWFSHHLQSGWGYDAFYQRMIGNLNWTLPASNNVIEGIATPPYRDLYTWRSDAMASGKPAGSLSAYTHSTGYTAKRQQQELTNTPILASSTTSDYASWDAASLSYKPYHPGKYPKAVQSGVPVITLLGQYDPGGQTTGIVYPPLFGSWGRIFNLSQPNLDNSNVCWLEVKYPDKITRIDLAAARHQSTVANSFAVNLPMVPFPSKATVTCKINDVQKLMAAQDITRPANLPMPAVTVGKEDGYSAVVQQIETAMALQASENVPKVDNFLAQAISHLSEKDEARLSPAAKQALARYRVVRKNVQAIDQWASRYTMTQPVTAEMKQQLTQLLTQHDLAMPQADVGRIEVHRECLAPSAMTPQNATLVFSSQCANADTKGWLIDLLGRVRYMAMPGLCLSDHEADDQGLPLISCSSEAPSWVTKHDQQALAALGGVLDKAGNRPGLYPYHGGSNQQVLGLHEDKTALITMGQAHTLNLVARVQAAAGNPGEDMPIAAASVTPTQVTGTKQSP